MAEPDQPKKETVRIELPLPPAINPPQPVVEPREGVRIQLPVREADGSPLAAEEKNSMVLYWLLLGLSALILIIQIWTYFS